MNAKKRRPTVPFVQAIVNRSAPNPARPRLPEEIERQLEPLERQTASCYAGSEAIARRTRELSDELGEIAHEIEDEAAKV